MNQRKISIFSTILCMLMAFHVSGIYAIKISKKRKNDSDTIHTQQPNNRIKRMTKALGKGSLGFFSGSLAATAVIIIGTCNCPSQKPHNPLFLTATYATALSAACITNALAQHYPKTILAATCTGIGITIAHIMQVMR